jgi:hypothetical protein
MNKILLGAISGIIFGIIAVLMMIPLKFEDKRSAMLGAFINRFAIGFLIGASALPIPIWVQGLIIGLLLSLPDAIITKSWLPIIGVGIVGGLVIGLIIDQLGR